MNSFTNNGQQNNEQPPNIKVLWRWLRRVVQDLYLLSKRERINSGNEEDNLPLQIRVSGQYLNNHIVLEKSIS
jgi:hypothetical protein